ncbi:uncharacterized protein LOC119093897 [Pollicipes pollicipes]|uniref:uncharacterized protein LOC119093897 n=1 Tax=Pollicipes pollicipes TaxID=41117 RepID=UPI001884F397|nr:uncharacterized protein LOC119093897 [Pollicipes pollicipes]
MNLLPFTSANDQLNQIDDRMSIGNKETILQAVLLALVATLSWGGPFRRGPAAGAILPDRHHVTEHLEGTMDQQSVQNISDDELRYHYFQSHDFDGNKALDGLEMLKAVLHAPLKTAESESDPSEATSTEGHKDGGADPMESAQFFVDVIDRVLSEDDGNKDGLLSYAEFVLANERASDRMRERELGQELDSERQQEEQQGDDYTSTQQTHQ